MHRRHLGTWIFLLAWLLLLQTPAPVRAASAPKLSHGPVVGNVTATSATIFARTSKPAAISIRYSPLATFENAEQSSTVVTTKTTDLTTQITLTGLEPETTYYLDILVDQIAQLQPPYPRFKTFPLQESSNDFKFVVLNDFGTNGSTQPPLSKPVKTFQRSAEENPAFVLIGGDFFHRNADALRVKRRLYRHNYELNSPAAPLDDFVTRILRQYPIAHMWDDHDIGANNAFKTYPFKAEARQALQEYVPVYPLGEGGDYQTFRYGQAQFWLLDARSFRDDQHDPDSPDKSLLDGDNLGASGQLQWLLNGLVTSTARWKFVVSPVPFNRSMVKNDSWVGFSYERQALVDFIHTNNIEGIVILSGDTHFGGIDDGTNSDFPEMLVPGPNLKFCETTSDPGLWSEGKYVRKYSSPQPCNGYGVVTVLTNPDRVLLQVKNQSGQLRLQYTVE